MNNFLTIAGVMTGTSCDGLDVSCVRFGFDGAWKALWSAESAYPAGLRKRVLKAQLPGATMTLRDWGALNRDLGSWLGIELAKVISRQRQKPDAIACHGQTVGHFPAPNGRGFTAQMGEAGRIAHGAGLTVITQFREGDMAAGGQGAPLAPRFHEFIARAKAGHSIAIHNLGGISNLTYLGPRGDLLAFDTGPGNCWIDAAAEKATCGKRRFDRDGLLAGAGTPDSGAVERILRMKYFAARPPKSTGRDDFPFELLQHATKASGADLVATATEITAQSAARAYRDFVYPRGELKAIYFCGGGARNRFLLKRIAQLLPGVQVATIEELGFDSKYLEAQAFAYFGFRALLGQALGGSWTGAANWAPPAHITPGRNWAEILPKLARANSTGPGASARSRRNPKSPKR